MFPPQRLWERGEVCASGPREGITAGDQNLKEKH